MKKTFDIKIQNGYYEALKTPKFEHYTVVAESPVEAANIACKVLNRVHSDLRDISESWPLLEDTND